ncbi:hypothetical protein FQN50_004907 [Emmonsiellopsis sp. PD_5]|nr:hypothetical protein FQN50_004907 [Emmonsiellopsis sp. PD_5]
METADLTPLLDQLEDNIDDLEEVLKPLLSQALSATTQKMPVLDKAKLHVLITYTIESMLFSYLRLHGVNAKEHPVFKELTRVRQYFEKIKAVETVPEKRTMTVDKEAAGRFIKHGLAGNDKHDLERAEREAKEKAMALLKAAKLARKNQEASAARNPPTEQPSTASGSSKPAESQVAVAPVQQPNLQGAQGGKKGKRPKTKKTKEQLLARKQARKEHKMAIKRQKLAAKKGNNEAQPQAQAQPQQQEQQQKQQQKQKRNG